MKSILVFLILSCTIKNEFITNSDEEPTKEITEEIIPAAELTEDYLSLLKDKKVGVVGNQTSVIGETHLVDSLLSLGIDVLRVYSPEHGFRGNADAGEKINHEVDQKTGLEIVSLYGKNKKPTLDQIKDLDVLLFDIQDVGVRFYTYISTLHYIMEAAAEASIPVIVLDRPNPNGHYIDGPVLDLKFESFVGMHKVPVVYGMTIGEYAKMINGEYWLKDSVVCDLEVVPCKGYTHSRKYELPIAPSPNLRTANSINLYPSLCFFEGTIVSIGRGTKTPFEIYGHPKFVEGNFKFTPTSSFGAKHPKLEGQECLGYNLKDTSDYKSRLDLSFLLNANEQLKGMAWIDNPKFFNLLAGNDILVEQIKKGLPEEEIRQTWKEDLNHFKLIRSKYLMYD